MNDEIPELAMRQDPIEPLGSAADQRVRARMLAALDDAQVDETPAGDSDETVVVDLTTDLPPGTRRPPVRRWLGVGAAAAAAVVVALALVVASDDEPPTTGFGYTPPSTTTAPGAIDPLGEVRVGTTWFYRAPVTVGPVSTEATLRLRAEAIDGAEVVASARVDIAASAGLGDVGLAVGPGGTVELPPVLLDPLARLFDCATESRLTVHPDRSPEGTMGCDGRVELLAASAGDEQPVEVPGFDGDAVPITVRWRLDGQPPTETVLWLMADVGVVRVDVAADTDDPTTYLLQERTP